MEILTDHTPMPSVIKYVGITQSAIRNRNHWSLTPLRPESNQHARAFKQHSVDGLSCKIDAMIYRGTLGRKTSLFILNSHEFFMPPSVAFCETAWRAGYQVIFIRRPGIVGSTPLPRVLTEFRHVRSGAAVAAEAAMLAQFIDQCATDDAVVLAMGGSSPVAYRLSHFCKRVTLFVFANPTFNQNVWSSFSPDWFRGLLKQVISSKSGVNISSLGIKHFLRRDALSFYRQILAQSAGDLDYVSENETDFIEAGVLAQSAPTAQLYYELSINLQLDPLLRPGVFKGRNVLAVSGAEANPNWREGIAQECSRLKVPLEFLPAGFIFGPYHKPEVFFDIIRRRKSLLRDNHRTLKSAS